MTPEQLEPRRLAASLAYSLDAPSGPLHVGQVLEVRILGQARYDAAGGQQGVFSWGVSAMWNTDWLSLVDVAIADEYGWLPLVEPLDGSDSTDALDLGGLLDFDALPLSGAEPVELAILTLQVGSGTTPGTLTGVQLGTGSRPSALLGVDDLVAADVSGAWRLWDVERHPAHNAELPADVDRDGVVVPLDALRAVNDFLRDGPRPATSGGYATDVDGDGTMTTPADVLAVFAAMA